MSKNIYNNLINLSKKIGLNFVNVDLIKKNSQTLFDEYLKIKQIYLNLSSTIHKNYTFRNIIITDSDYNQIINIIKNNFLADNSKILNHIKNTQSIYYFQWNNIKFYCLNPINKITSNYHSETNNYKKCFDMFLMSICLNIYKFNYTDSTNRIIYWIPIDKSRNFNFSIINKHTLKIAENNFEAFVASGVTWGSNPKYTIITRFEEIEKLLLHELIHNYNIDGSAFHHHNHNIIKNYAQIKKSGNYDYTYSIYESYTELLSSYFNMIFTNIKLNMKEKKIKKKFFCQIIIELLYSYNLIANLIKLNGYENYNHFIREKIFKGNICFYEYYYVKGLLYNNFELMFGSNPNDFKIIYGKINDCIGNDEISNDKLLKLVYTNSFPQINYKYIIIN